MITVILDPASDVEEAVQNVRTILATLKGTVPLDRNFGVNCIMLDAPQPAAEAAMTADIIEAITKYEPRAKPVNVQFAIDHLTGKLAPKVYILISPGGGLIDV